LWDTLNILEREDQEFQWSQAYNYYKALSLDEKKMNLIWTLGIALAGCIPEVTNFRELISGVQKNSIREENNPTSMTTTHFFSSFNIHQNVVVSHSHHVIQGRRG
jgi:hypothetical protein